MLREALPAADRSESGYVLRFNTTDDLPEYLSGPQPAETAWLSPARQHEEAWFLGLRLNAGVKVAALRRDVWHAHGRPGDGTSRAWPRGAL